MVKQAICLIKPLVRCAERMGDYSIDEGALVPSTSDALRRIPSLTIDASPTDKKKWTGIQLLEADEIFRKVQAR